MIAVPRISEGSIAPSDPGLPRLQSNVTAEGLGANVGRALQGMGQQFAEIQYREQQKTNAAVLNQARSQLADHERAWFDPNNPDGITKYQGANALQLPDKINTDLTDYATKLRGSMTNADQQAGFDQIYAAHRGQALDRANSYALGENDKYQQQAFEGAVGSALSAATTKATAGDLAGADLALQDGTNTIAQHGAAQGWDEAFTRYAIDKFHKSVDAATSAANKANNEAYIAQNPQQALADYAARLGIGGQGATAASVDAGAPRGIRNNNPGNLQQSDVQWHGKVASTDPRYESFASPEAGIRALALNAQHLLNKGAQTVGDLIGQWAPASENGKAKTAAYVADVAQQMGVSPTANINLQDPAQLTALTTAIISHENGQNPYTAEQVANGVQAALGKTTLRETHPPVTLNGSGMVVPADGSAPSGAPQAPGQLGKSGNFMVDALGTGDVVQMYNRAREEVSRNQVNLRGGIEQRERDDTAAFQAGKTVPQPLGLGDYTRAFGDAEGMRRYGAYQANQQLGQDLQTVATLTPQQMQDLATARAPAVGENFAVKEQAQRSLTTAMQQTLAARQKDPALWAQQAGVGGLKPIDTSAPDKLADSIAARVGPMKSLASTYQMPYRLMTTNEAAALSSTINALPAKQRAVALGQLSSKLDAADYGQVISTIKDNSPVSAIAGQIMGAGRVAQVGTAGSLWWKSPITMSAQDIAQTMLDGDALINPTKADKDENGAPKFKLPPDSATSGLGSTWNDIVGDAYRGDGAGEMQAFQAYRAMYAGLAAKAGKMDGILDPKMAEQAARATIGNVVDWNGKNVIPPYGMDENVFTDAANKAWQARRAEVPGADQQDLDGYDLDRIGDGVYAVSNGQAPLRDKDGQPVVIRINAANAAQIHEALRMQAKPKADAFKPTGTLEIGGSAQGGALTAPTTEQMASMR